MANIAFNKKVIANGVDASSITSGKYQNCIIGDHYPVHIDIDLESNFKIDKIKIIGADVADFTYNVYTSIDGVNFDRYGNTATKADDTISEIDGSSEARVIRVLVTSSSQGRFAKSYLAGVEAFGEKLDSEIIPTRQKLEFDNYDTWLKKKHGVDLSLIKDENGRYDRKQSYTANDTIEALHGLVTRILGKEYINWFEFEIDREYNNGNFYELSDSNGKIRIKADNGVSAATGLNYYLKYFCKVHISQQTKQVKMPENIISIGKVITQKSPYKVRYAYNYCTLSYTMAYFGYEQWIRELDFLMLSGVNLILDITGTEALWVSYLQKLGYTADEAKNYFCGYCYKAWLLMGNLEGYGGPVADSWVLDTLEMARINQRYMTVMGAMPALSTFVGAMPESFISIASKHLSDKGFGDVAPYVEPQGLWADGFLRPNIVKTTYPGYSYLAELFYETQDEIYGQLSDYYCGDVCHEGGIVPKDCPKTEMSKRLLDELLKSDDNAVWILQAWWSNPLKEVLDGFGDKRKNHILLLDLASLANPKWIDEKTWGGKEFGGTPWIYCILDNYGGRTGMHGKLRKMATLIDEAGKNSNLMWGIGITPEATNQNPFIFDLFWEMAWRDEAPDIDEWVKEYVERRYGQLYENAYEAWKIFEQTIYGLESSDGTTKNNVINDNASLTMGHCKGKWYKIPYSRYDLEKGVATLVADFEKLSDSECYIYDLVDFFRMVLTISCDDYFELLKRAFALKKSELFKKYSTKYLNAMELIAEICAYNKDEMLGNWIGYGFDWANDERNGRYSDFDYDMMEFNAKIIISDWASSPITNYANRQYDGLMTDYFSVMWSELLNLVNTAFENGTEPPEKLSLERCFDIGWQFVINGKTYRRDKANPNGNGKDRGLLAIWQDITDHLSDGKNVNDIIAELDELMKDIEVSDKVELSATIATNIEH